MAGWLSELNTPAVLTTSFFDASPIVTGMVGTPRSGRISTAIRTFSGLQSCAAIAGSAVTDNKPAKNGNVVIDRRIAPSNSAKFPHAIKARAGALCNSKMSEKTVMFSYQDEEMRMSENGFGR